MYVYIGIRRRLWMGGRLIFRDGLPTKGDVKVAPPGKFGFVL